MSGWKQNKWESKMTDKNRVVVAAIDSSYVRSLICFQRIWTNLNFYIHLHWLDDIGRDIYLRGIEFTQVHGYPNQIYFVYGDLFNNCPI